ncbi:VOC family protein [Paenibacillus mendelii]|uniref:VOC family protein n=1 Tax=Paenibacillus mendelii TaxID=206163 RepID=A0ABV6JK98_9BACL|nr:VOC family protein [Paenibacillus mendelii]MCQ6559908.1 VOC family protein [Paenibacillus mendelii]
MVEQTLMNNQLGVSFVQEVKRKINTGPTMLLVSNLSESRRYYEEVLGCEYDDCGHTSREGLFLLMYEANNIEDVKPISSIPGGPPWDILAYTESQEELFEEFKAKGAIIRTELSVSQSGWKEFVIQDLDGYKIGFGG